MNFLEIQNRVLFDRFSESRRDYIKESINARYGRVWAQESWSFKKTLISTTVALGAQTVSLSALGLQRIESVWAGVPNGYGSMYADKPEDFHRWASTVGGRTYGFTVIGDTLRLDRPLSEATTLHIVGEAKFTPLEDDTDVPLIPEEFHMMLVHGAASEELRMENDPTWQGFEQDYQAYLLDMLKAYLTNVRGSQDAYPAWPYPGY